MAIYCNPQKVLFVVSILRTRMYVTLRGSALLTLIIYAVSMRKRNESRRVAEIKGRSRALLVFS